MSFSHVIFRVVKMGNPIRLDSIHHGLIT